MRSKASNKMCLVVVVAFLISTCSSMNADFTFGTPVNLGPAVSSSYYELGPCISPDGLLLYCDSDRSGGYDNVISRIGKKFGRMVCAPEPRVL